MTLPACAYTFLCIRLFFSLIYSFNSCVLLFSRVIQDQTKMLGHSSAEDAQAALDLVKLKLLKGGHCCSLPGEKGDGGCNSK
jgi:hypothetical protein